MSSTTQPAPLNISDYLQALRRALAGSDPALIQDALYDAEEHLRAVMAEHPQRSEAEVLGDIASSYGAPEEVAEIYRDQEVRVQRAIQAPKPAPTPPGIRRFFAVAADPRAYAALLYMFLSLATGTFYFTWVTTGVSLSLGLLVLIIGIPFLVLFLATTRLLSLIEGRLIEAMLGMRMPRRPAPAPTGETWLNRIGALFTDYRTWSTLLYQLLMLPLGIIYFTVAITIIATGCGLIVGSVAMVLDATQLLQLEGATFQVPVWTAPLWLLVGVLLLFLSLHLARLVGHLHGQLAKQMLVQSGFRADSAQA